MTLALAILLSIQENNHTLSRNPDVIQKGKYEYWSIITQIRQERWVWWSLRRPTQQLIKKKQQKERKISDSALQQCLSRPSQQHHGLQKDLKVEHSQYRYRTESSISQVSIRKTHIHHGWSGKWWWEKLQKWIYWFHRQAKQPLIRQSNHIERVA